MGMKQLPVYLCISTSFFHVSSDHADFHLLYKSTRCKSDGRVQELNSSFSAMSFGSTMSGEAVRKPDITLSSVSSSPDASFRNFLRQDSNHSNTFCPSSPISPVVRQQGRLPQLVRHSSYSDDSQGLGSQQSGYSPVGMHTFARSFSGDGLLPPPPNLDSNFDITTQYQDAPQSPFVTKPSKPENPFSEVNINRDRSYSSPGSVRQLPIGSKSPLPPSNQVLFENKISSSWNEGPGFPSPHIYKGDSMSTSAAPGDRFSCRPPRYGGNREVSPRADPRSNLSSEGAFNFPPQTNYSNQSSPAPNPNHMRSQSLGVGFSGSHCSDSFPGYNRNNSHGGG